MRAGARPRIVLPVLFDPARLAHASVLRCGKRLCAFCELTRVVDISESAVLAGTMKPGHDDLVVALWEAM